MPTQVKGRYNVFSRLLLLWTEPLFWLGCHRTLEQNDLYAHPSDAESEMLLNKFNRYWSGELSRRKEEKQPRLFLTIVRCVWFWMAVHGVLLFVKTACFVGQSVLLGYLADTFDPDDVTLNLSAPNVTIKQSDTGVAYLYVAGISLLAFVVMLAHNHAFLLGGEIGMKARIIMTGAVYQKVLTLSQVVIGKISVGHIVNLASNDVQRFDLAFLFFHLLWIAPLHLAVITYLVFVEVGWSAFMTIAFIGLQVLLQIFLTRLYAHLRLKSALHTDKRVRVMNEVITGIRVIKIYAWEYAFKRVVTNIRRKESLLVLIAGFFHSASLTIGLLSHTVTAFLIFAVHASTGGELTPKNVVTTLSLLIQFRTTLGMLYRCIYLIVEGKVAIIRLQNLLKWSELDFQNGADCSRQTAVSISVKDMSVSWSNSRSSVLADINFKICSSNEQLMIVIGPVGSGKSTLIQCLLKELMPAKGEIEVNGRVSYAPQDPWVFSATLRENILFGKPYEEDLYRKVIQACALEKDIDMLVSGDLTLVGERGVTLSGGQKARVNLARAVYHDADIYLLDDPLSAVDAEVGKHIFERCICGLLKNHLVILVTHQVHFAGLADQVLVLKDGRMEAYGSPADLLAKGLNSQHLLGLISAHKHHHSGYKDDKNAATESPLSFNSHLGSNFGGEPESSLIDTESLQSSSSIKIDKEHISAMIPEERQQGTVSSATYYHYFRAGGNMVFVTSVLVLVLIAEAGAVSTDWWLTHWASCTASPLNTSSCSLSANTWISVYSGMVIFAVIGSLARALTLFFLFVNASRVLHNRMFGALLRAPVLFFDTNPIGRILNRFSKDVGFLDDLLPQHFTEYIVRSMNCVAIVIAALVANWWSVFPAGLFLVGLLLIRWYFLKTGREVKRLEAIARSPVYSHISATLQGLPIIRSFGKQHIAIQQFHNFQNQHTQGWYMYLITSRWLAMRVDTLSSIYIVSVLFILVGLSEFMSDRGLIGLSLAYIASSTVILHMVQLSAEIENLMISAERIMEYGHLEPEASLESDLKPPDDWPQEGKLCIKDLVFRYSPDLPMVLKNVSFSVRASEKVGIVGRTGAGKSSLLSVLYRLAEPYGQVTIDGVETKSIGLHDLRKKMSIIPQDPVLFSGSMRYNLDPFEEYSDAELWEVLEQVQLKAAVEELEGQLSGEVSEGGSNFSVGQRQLVCLARALLRKNKILILDEATANVDPKTDEIIQLAIREKFKECTVLTIAHRLNTIMDSDRILVMHNGQVQEYASPYKLLQNPHSMLYKMVEKTGPEASRTLHQIAIDTQSRAN